MKLVGRTPVSFLALLVVLSISAKASAAVAVDAVTSAQVSNTTLAWSHTVGAGSNRLLVVGVSTSAGTTVSGVTYGTAQLTKVGSVTDSVLTAVYRLVAPATGTNTITVTLSGSDDQVGGAISFTGVDQAAPLKAAFLAGQGTNPSTTVASRTGDIVFDVFSTVDSSATVDASQTQRWNLAPSTVGAGSTKAGASSVTMAWSTGNKKFAHAAVSVRAAGINPGTLLTGTYTGNAIDSTAISSQLGFVPDVLFIKGHTTQEAVVHTVTMNGDLSKPLTTSTALTANLIESFNGISGLMQGGFTVGSDARVNSNTLVYDYVALTAKAGEVFVGSYIGNGVDNTGITGVGFQPAVVMVFSDLTVPAVYRSSQSGDVTNQFNNVAAQANCIQTFQADGFQVGTDNQCNASGTQYYYVAWKAVTAKLAVGSYTGNGADNVNITVASGFGTPVWVIAKSVGAIDAVQKMAITDPAVDTACFFRNIACAANGIQDLHTDGFQVGTAYNVNTTVYYYIAFGTQVSVTAVGLASFSATPADHGDTLLKWRTGYEVNNLGFNVYREERGVRTRLTPSLVGGSGLTVAPGNQAGSGHSYQWVDREPIVPNATVTYWLEDIDLNGTRALHGPFVPVTGTWTSSEAAPSVLLQRLAKPNDQKSTAERSDVTGVR